MTEGNNIQSSPSVEGNVDTRGTFLENVSVEIDFAIIEHFSKHLYGSSNKAIEELVSNGFDALAKSVYVYITGSFTNNRVLVWDDGHSMDVNDLHRLWWIAQSPKDEGERIKTSTDGERKRAMIGKFGIGKLASYAVGHRLTHLCKQDGRFLRVAVDYRRAPHLQEIREGESREPLQTPIVELTEEEALEYVKALFNGGSKAVSEIWRTERWTLAVIDELKEGIRLTEGRLSWVVGNGMPLRPDFRVWINDEEVESKLAKGARASWDVCEPIIQEKLASEWKTARNNGFVEGEYTFPSDSERVEGKVSVQLPSLGEVEAEVHLFDQSLRQSRSLDQPRSYGFFAMVRGRLLNPEDALLSMSDPSYGTFYRCQYVIRADGLDEDLLADRERLHLDTPRAKELAVLRDALYLASRQALENYDEQAEKESKSESLLPIESREHFREPLTALLLSGSKTLAQPLDSSGSARIERAALDEVDPIAIVNREGGGFQVNLTHPLLKAVQLRLGGGRKAQEAMRAFDLFAVSERLFEGYLHDTGIPDEQINRILRWRDGLLRAMALRYEAAPTEEVVSEVQEASYSGGKAFEDALAKLFGRMGFETARDGASGHKDVLVVAPIGIDEYRFTVEAKGSQKAINNDDAEIGGADAHRDQVGAKMAIVVAREFAGFVREREEKPAILQECETSGRVTIVTVDTLAKLLEAVRAYHYPLSDILNVLEEVESPAEKLDRVQGLRNPTEGFDFRGVLEEIWKRQQGQAQGDMVPYRTLWQAGPNRWGETSPEGFLHRLHALEALSGYLLRVLDSEKSVIMYQNPEIVANCIQQAVEVQERLD